MKDHSLIDIIQQIQTGKISAGDVHTYFSTRIKKFDSQIQSYVSTQDFENSDTHKNKLAGIPIAIKDIFAQKGKKTSGASNILKNFNPPYNATVVERLQEAGMSTLGNLNMDEFAMGSTTENSAIAKTRNPWGTDRIPGGSSGGSAAAVAAGLAPAALGTDTGGSLRQPASMCGVVGFRPSYGRNSRFGVFPLASCLDCPGTITKTVKDAGFLYEIMNGEDTKENTSLEGKDILDPKIWENTSLKGTKIGLPKEYFDEGLDPSVKETIQEAVRKLESLGAEIKEITLPMTKYAIAAYYIIVPAEVSTNLARLDGIRYGTPSTKAYASTDKLYHNNRGEGLGEEAQRRSVVGSYVLSSGFYDAYFMKAAQVRTLIIEDFKKVFEEVDIIAGPASPSVAWKLGEGAEDPLKMYLADMYTVPSALAGLPGISVPCGFAESNDSEKEILPVGLQMIAPRLEEEKLLRIAHTFEESAGWKNKMTPPGFED